MQKTVKNISLAVPTLVLALTALVTVPVFADHGSADSGSGDSSSTSGSSGSSSGGSGPSTTSGSHDAAEAPSNQSELRSKGKQMVAELEQEHKSGKSQTEKTQACENHKQGLQTKFTRITTNASNLETKIGGFLAKAEAYQSSKNVTVTGWDSLVVAANTAKTNADTAIANLNALQPTVDCSSTTTVANDVATFKAAAQAARDALQAYKTAVKDVFVALENAKGATDTSATTTTGGTSND